MSLVILLNHNIHHIYLNLAVLLTYNQNCMMYYMRLCNAEHSQNSRVLTHIFKGALLGKILVVQFLEGT